jgi:hypothetical protein
MHLFLKNQTLFYVLILTDNFFRGPGTVEPITPGSQKIFPGTACSPWAACCADLNYVNVDGMGFPLTLFELVYKYKAYDYACLICTHYYNRW